MFCNREQSEPHGPLHLVQQYSKAQSVHEQQKAWEGSSSTHEGIQDSLGIAAQTQHRARPASPQCNTLLCFTFQALAMCCMF